MIYTHTYIHDIYIQGSPWGHGQWGRDGKSWGGWHGMGGQQIMEDHLRRRHFTHSLSLSLSTSVSLYLKHKLINASNQAIGA